MVYRDVDAETGAIIIADTKNHRICSLDPKTGVVQTIAGSNDGVHGCTDGDCIGTLFNNPSGVAVNPKSGTIVVVDTHNNKIRQIFPDGHVETLAGSTFGIKDGAGDVAMFRHPRGVAVDPDSGDIFVADTYNHCIRRIARDGVVSTVGAAGTDGAEKGKDADAAFNSPVDVAFDADTGTIYVADTSNHRICQINKATGIVSTVAGCKSKEGFKDGNLDVARFSYPAGIAVDRMTGNIIVVDGGNGTIREIELARYWQRKRHHKASAPIKRVVVLLHQIQHRKKQGIREPIWIPNELWYIIPALWPTDIPLHMAVWPWFPRAHVRMHMVIWNHCTWLFGRGSTRVPPCMPCSCPCPMHAHVVI